MTRLRSLLGCAAIATIVGLGMPSLTSAASAATEPPITDPVAAPDLPAAPTPTETTPAEPASPPVATEPSTPPSTGSDPESTPPAPAESATTEPAVEAANELAPAPALAVPTYGVTVTAVCVDVKPFVNVESTGTGDVQVTVGPESIVRTAAEPKGQLPWPTVDGSTPDTVAKWDAIRLDTMGPVANGVLPLPDGCAAATPTVPSAPTGLVATPGDTSVTLRWSPPTSDGGSKIVDYVVETSSDGISGWTTVKDGSSVATSATITGLKNGTVYYFRVLAVNEHGPSPASVDVKVTPRAAPGAPRSLAAAPTNLSGQIRLAWAAPASNGGPTITDYVIQRSPNGSTGWVTVNDGVSTSVTYTATGLTNGARYYFRVYAKSANGASSASNTASAIPRYVLTAARSLAATPGNRSVRLSWTTPLSNGGAAIRDYVIQRSPNGSTGWATVNDGISTATTYTVGGLTNGARYYFRVFARTAKATSASSNVVNAIPRTMPTAPRSVAAAPTNLSGQVRLTWAGPASNGGSATTDYIIQRSYNGTTWTTLSDGVGTTPSYTSTGMANGARYYFRVFAHNAAGNSTSSTVVSAIPRTVPGAVGYFGVDAYFDGFDLYWGDPVSTGGSPITGFVVLAYDPEIDIVRTTFGVADPSWRDGLFEYYGSGCVGFSIAAVNAAGVGPYSDPVAACQ